MKTYFEVEDLEVYQKLCVLHIEVCDLSHKWPAEEKYELGATLKKRRTKYFEVGIRSALGCWTDLKGLLNVDFRKTLGGGAQNRSTEH